MFGKIIVKPGSFVLLAASGLFLLAACAPVAGVDLPGSEPSKEETPMPTPTPTSETTPVTPQPSPTSPGGSPEDTPTRPVEHTPERLPTPLTGGQAELPETPVVGEVPDDLLQKIYDYLEQTFGVDVSQLVLWRAEAVTWPDGSLGCPVPGEMYTMALVEGYWIQLQYQEQVYDIRATQQGTFKLCEQGLSLKQPGASPFLNLQEPDESEGAPGQGDEIGPPQS